MNIIKNSSKDGQKIKKKNKSNYSNYREREGKKNGFILSELILNSNNFCTHKTNFFCGATEFFLGMFNANLNEKNKKKHNIKVKITEKIKKN